MPRRMFPASSGLGKTERVRMSGFSWPSTGRATRNGRAVVFALAMAVKKLSVLVRPLSFMPIITSSLSKPASAAADSGRTSEIFNIRELPVENIQKTQKNNTTAKA